MKTFLVIAAVLVVYFCSGALARPAKVEGDPIFKSCSDYPDKLLHATNIVVPGCTAPPCTLIKGKNSTVNITFVALQDDKLPDGGYLTMCGQLGPICPTLQPSDPKICDFAKCPIKKGDTFNVALSIPIDSHYPSLTVTARLYTEPNEKDTDLKDEVSCAELSIKLQS